MSVDPAFSGRAQKFAETANGGANLAPAIKGISTGDTAALRVETINGTFVVEQRLRVQLECLERPDPAARALQGGGCWRASMLCERLKDGWMRWSHSSTATI
jgi:hypothetical protein